MTDTASSPDLAWQFADLTELCKKTAQLERSNLRAGIPNESDAKQQLIDKKDMVLNRIVAMDYFSPCSIRNYERQNVYALATRSYYWTNEEFMKMSGLQCYMFHKIFNYNTVMVCSEHPERKYAYLNQMPGLTLETFPNAHCDELKYVEGAVNYINKNYQKMDIVTLHGSYPPIFPVLEFYRKKRPDGKVYISLDMNTGWCEEIEFPDDCLIRFLDNCDVISTGCSRMANILNKKWQGHIIENIPSSFYPFFGEVTADYEHKKNTILTVGRIGTKQKCNELLLIAFALVADKIKNWNLRLVGPIDDSFIEFKSNFFRKYPSLIKRITFAGNITDKKQLYSEYRNAKIFTLTSTVEGGPNVIGEALYHGCYPIVSDFDASDDITKNGELGRVFPLRDYQALAKVLVEICGSGGGEAVLKDAFPKIMKYAREFYNWETNIKKIHALLFGVK